MRLLYQFSDPWAGPEQLMPFVSPLLDRFSITPLSSYKIQPNHIPDKPFGPLCVSLDQHERLAITTPLGYDRIEWWPEERIEIYAGGLVPYGFWVTSLPEADGSRQCHYRQDVYWLEGKPVQLLCLSVRILLASDREGVIRRRRCELRAQTIDTGSDVQLFRDLAAIRYLKRQLRLTTDATQQEHIFDLLVKARNNLPCYLQDTLPAEPLAIVTHFDAAERLAIATVRDPLLQAPIS